MAKKLYVCDRFPELILVKKSQRRTIVDGEVVNHEPHHLLFKKTGLGGEYATEDEGEQKFIEGHEFYKQGVIVLADAGHKSVAASRGVKQAPVGAPAPEAQAPVAPADVPPAVPAMRTPKRRGRPRAIAA